MLFCELHNSPIRTSVEKFRVAMRTSVVGLAGDVEVDRTFTLYVYDSPKSQNKIVYVRSDLSSNCCFQWVDAYMHRNQLKCTHAKRESKAVTGKSRGVLCFVYEREGEMGEEERERVQLGRGCRGDDEPIYSFMQRLSTHTARTQRNLVGLTPIVRKISLHSTRR